jgi:hypothetical protein
MTQALAAPQKSKNTAKSEFHLKPTFDVIPEHQHRVASTAYSVPISPDVLQYLYQK